MIPGSAIGSTNRNETESRPKKRERATAERRERPEHERDAGREKAGAERQPERVAHLLVVPRRWNHFVVKPGIGQLWMFEELNA